MKRYTKPTPQTTMNISEGAYEFIEGHKWRSAEPKYQVLDRIIGEYEQQKDLIISLRNELEEKDVIIEDLRDTSKRQWDKLQMIESRSQV